MTNQRLKDLEDNIKQDEELLKDFEDALRYERNPRVIGGYRQEIERQKESITCYKSAYIKLQQELAGEQTAQIQLQKVDNQLQQIDKSVETIDNKINILLSGQVAIYADINELRIALLNRYDASEQTIVAAITQELSQNQLVLTQQLLDGVENNQVSELQMQQMLAVLEERVPSLPPSQAAAIEIIKDLQFDVKHKIKVTLPIIPMLVDYEGELELGSGLNIRSAWEHLVSKLRSK